MKSVKIADLKNNLSRYLVHVREGGELVVLDRDTPVARIVPFGPRESAAGASRTPDTYWTEARLTDMERQGVISRGDPRAIAAWLKEAQPLKLPKGTPGVVDVLLQMRRESRR